MKNSVFVSRRGARLLLKILAALCTALVANTFVAGTYPKTEVIHVTLLGYLMVNSIAILGYVMGTPLHKFIMIAVTATGALMFVTAGALLCETYDILGSAASERLLGAGILGMINGCVYIVDILFTFKENTSD